MGAGLIFRNKSKHTEYNAYWVEYISLSVLHLKIYIFTQHHATRALRRIALRQ